VPPKAWLVVPGLREHFAERRRQAEAARAEAHAILKAGGSRRTSPVSFLKKQMSAQTTDIGAEASHNVSDTEARPSNINNVNLLAIDQAAADLNLVRGKT
jgi:hypothetical protein